MQESNIPIGVQSFRALREQQQYYVDKTGFIGEFLRGVPPQVSFIARPKGFGKSLMLSMLQEFFDKTKDSRALFDGLAAAKDKALCEKWMNRSHVIFLSFSGIKGRTFAEALDCFKLLAASLCSQYSWLLESPAVYKLYKTVIDAAQKGTADKVMLRFILAMLCEAVYQDSGEYPVILIDEYDAPLAEIRPGEEYEELSDFIRALLETGLKTNTLFRFAVVTGCLPPAEHRIYDLNNWAIFDDDDVHFTDKFGFTSAEVDELLAALNMRGEKEAVEKSCTSVCFGRHKMYCPKDILLYLHKAELI